MKRALSNRYGFIDTVFSWSLQDILNENLFRKRVKQIPLLFQSDSQYFMSFVFPLLEETRANLFSSLENISNAPFAQVVAFEDSNPCGSMLYDVKVDCWENRFSDLGKEPYKTLPGDILVVADDQPETASDLQRVARIQTSVVVTKIIEVKNESDEKDANENESDEEDADKNENDTRSTCFQVKASREIHIDGAKNHHS